MTDVYKRQKLALAGFILPYMFVYNTDLLLLDTPIDVYKRQKLPLLEGKTDTVTMMSYGFDPYLSSWSPYHGAIYAVLSSVAKIVANGGDYKKIRFTFQEYFRRMTEDPTLSLIHI